MKPTASWKNNELINRIYDEFGFVHVTELFSNDEVNRLKNAYDEALLSGNIHEGDEEIVNMNDAIYTHPVFEHLMSDERIIQLAENIIGTQVELQHSKLFSKPKFDKGKGEVKWHQDFPFFPHTNYDLAALAIHLDDETEESGPLQFISGSHKLGVLSHCSNGEFVYHCTEDINYDSYKKNIVICNAGHITVHHGLTLHSSAQKTISDKRRILYLQFRAGDAKQLAGVIWKCTGYQPYNRRNSESFARFPDGTLIELRGKGGRLFDLFGILKPDGAAKFGITKQYEN